MRLKNSHIRVLWRPLLALVLAGAMLLMSPTPATAQDLNPSDYFQFSYEPVTFDKSRITEGEVFHATIAGSATCTKDLPVPLPVSEVIVISQVVAAHTESSITVILNQSYTINVRPFPSKAGETTEISQSVPLQFPPAAESGDYNVIWKINEARIKLALASLEITRYLPPELPMGTVEYAPAVSNQTGENPPAPTPTETPAPTAPPPGPNWAIWGPIFGIMVFLATFIPIRYRRRKRNI